MPTKHAPKMTLITTELNTSSAIFLFAFKNGMIMLDYIHGESLLIREKCIVIMTTKIVIIIFITIVIHGLLLFEKFIANSSCVALTTSQCLYK